MKVMKQYKTFNNETGEIRIDCRAVSSSQSFRVYQNDEVLHISKDENEAIEYYEKLKEMDEYISKKLKWYEVYEIL